ncbi:phage tail sheath subtilisin-like domain-containing protein [Acidothermaceae bacterium B102]|nr:phage tail sheath subtilisin-like domain-containing protein [Acidothermaceae bacterium B102]
MATTYGAPGVYIEEVASGSMPIQGVGTAVAAFVGFTKTYNPAAGDPRDPEGLRPQLVTSWDQYERIYGGYALGAMLPYAVSGFFANGGSTCFIVRLPGGDAMPRPGHVAVNASGRPDLETLHVEALDAGSMLDITIDRPGPPEEGQDIPQEFTLRIMENGDQREEYGGLSLGRGGRGAERVINETSTLIRVKVQNQPGLSVAERLPAAGVLRLEPQAAVALQAGPQDVEGSVSQRTGYKGLAIADSVTIVAIPDLVTIATSPEGVFDLEGYIAMQGQLVDWCDQARTRMAILDSPPGLGATGALEWREQLARDSAFAAAYYPQVVVQNPLAPVGATNGHRYLTVPASGHIAGVWARTDGVRGVHKAPANETIQGIVRLENDVTTGEQDLLNPEGVNCLRSFGTGGMRIWGARTLATSDPSWRYIPVRRLFIYIEESIRRGTQWVVFEPNDRDLWERVKRTITAFLRGLWRTGALVGATPEQAFYVKCDASNNPPESVDEGKLIVEVGICPVKPAEFVIFRISQWQGGTETAE